jgi:hypothetical protein
MRYTLVLAVFCAIGLCTSVAAQERVSTPECKYVYGVSPNNVNAEWLCPKGVKYVYRERWFGPAYMVKGAAGDGQCIFHQEENAWLCPFGTKVAPNDAKIVMPK